MAVIYVRFRDDSGARAMPATKRCTRADPRHKEQPGWVDRLSYRGGVLYAHHADPQPWSGPVVSLGDCNPGDLVFLEHGKDAVGQSAWMLWQVVEGGAAPAI